MATIDDIFQQSQSFFSADGNYTPGLLPLQTDPTMPQVSGTETATGMVLPDRSIQDRLAHFPDNLYDLRPESHLVRFLQALLGDSGAGQLRKRNAIAQFQATIQGARFYDLDSFYGAIFNVGRFTDEALWVNPMTEVLPPNEWDEINSSDASYRDRVFRLATAINLGATYPGIKAAAEALIQTECEVYEVWSLLDTYGTGSLGRTFDQVEALGTWDQLQAQVLPSATWADITDIVQIGRTGINNRAEVVVVPKKDYTALAAQDGPEEAQRQRAEDIGSLVRVLNIIKPASVLITVDPAGIPLNQDVEINYLVADSNYWDVTTHLTPKPRIAESGRSPYLLSQKQIDAGLTDADRRAVPVPPLLARQTQRWAYNSEVVAVKAYTFQPQDPSLDGPGSGVVVNSDTSDTVTYLDGSTDRFIAERAVLDPQRALAARYSGDGMLTAHPYSGIRQEVPTHG